MKLGNGHAATIESRVDDLETNVGKILGELGRFSTAVEAFELTVAEFRAIVNHLSDQVEERPSRTEMDRDIRSVRAKVAQTSSSELELQGPMRFGLKMRGVSGVTVVSVIGIIATVVFVAVLVAWAAGLVR